MLARLPIALFVMIACAAAAELGTTGAKPASQKSPVESSPPVELTISVPPGWTRQQDDPTRVIYMKPPNSPAVRDAALAVFPAIDFTGTAEQFHSQTLATAVGKNRLLEPVHLGRSGGFLASALHLATPQGTEIRMILYTASWGARAQAVLFAADRKDLFDTNWAAADAVMSQVAVLSGAPASPAKAKTSEAPDASAGGSNSNPAPSIASATPAPGAINDSASAETIPVLDYEEPANFFRGASRSFSEYTSTEVNFALCIYPFRAFSGNIVATFRQTLLRDWIDLMYQEERLAAPPEFTTSSLTGTTTVIQARFHEALAGLPNERMRILIVVGNMAAIVDAKAPNPYCWQKAGPSVTALMRTLKISRKAAPPNLANGPGPQGAALAGLYGGTKPKYMAIGVVDYTSHIQALHFFLFSADGRVFRCYDTPPAGGDWRGFDFATSERQDPGNTGRFAVRGNELYIKWGGPQTDEITTTITDPNTLLMDSVTYVRKR